MKGSVGRRVLMLLENYSYPADPRVGREARALIAAGYQVSVISPATPGQPWRELIDGVRVYRFAAPPAANGFLSYLWEYSYSMAAIFLISLFVFLHEGFDVVHAANPPDTFVFIAAFYKLFGKQFVYDHHDLAPEMYYARFGGSGNTLVYHALILVEKLSCRLADHIITTNQSYKAIEMQRGQVPEERITIVRNGPDLNRFAPTEPDSDLRQKATTIIAYAGVMGFQDGVDYLLRALRYLVYDLGRTDFFCILIGKGDAWAGLKALATQLDLDKFVWFTGFVPDAEYIRYLSTADICVDPDPANPFNDRSTMNKMMEYMALGKPIVAFDLTEHRVTAKEAAVYACPNDEFNFAQQIASLMDDPERCKQMGRVGRERIETKLAWSHQERHLLDAYRALNTGLLERRPVSQKILALVRSLSNVSWKRSDD